MPPTPPAAPTISRPVWRSSNNPCTAELRNQEPPSIWLETRGYRERGFLAALPHNEAHFPALTRGFRHFIRLSYEALRETR